MNLPAIYSSSVYKVSTPIYEGPLDLLLQLIEKAELDITRLALAQVTDQFLAHIRGLQDQAAAEEVSGFSGRCRPASPNQIGDAAPTPTCSALPDEEDPGETLARQLIAYKRFKEIANLLALREVAGLRTYLRVAPSLKPESTVDLSGLSLDDLLAAAQQALLSTDDRLSVSQVVSIPKVSIREKIGVITNYLQIHGGRALFRQLFHRRALRLEIVVTFLAVLELVKRSMIQAQQTDLFGDIEIHQFEAWDENTAFELEFGE